MFECICTLLCLSIVDSDGYYFFGADMIVIPWFISLAIVSISPRDISVPNSDTNKETNNGRRTIYVTAFVTYITAHFKIIRTLYLLCLVLKRINRKRSILIEDSHIFFYQELFYIN